MQLGGCAHNAAHAAGLFHIPFQLASPVGAGIYGDFVRQELAEEKLPVWQNSEEKNGACYCLVDEKGNRSFLSIQGAEYHFQKDWLNTLNADQDTWVYLCGLEMENETGENLVSYAEKIPSKICFAPGPRLEKIPDDIMERMLKRADLIHLNAREAMAVTHTDTVKEAAMKLHSYHQADIVITDGGNPVTVMQENLYQVPAVPCKAVDGTGAGDSHIGSILACLCKGMSLKEAVVQANQISSLVCQHAGACIQESDITGGRD